MYYYMAMSLFYQKEHQEAAPYFDKAIELVAVEPDFFAGRGRNYYYLERPDSAIANLRIAAQMENCNAGDIAVLGIILLEEKQQEEAIENLKRARNLFKENTVAHKNCGFNIALAYQQLKDYEAGKDFLEQHLKIYKDDHSAIAKIIQMHYALSEFSQAQPWMQKLQKAQGDEDFPKQMKSMYCFDQFDWQPNNVMSFTNYGPSEQEILSWQYKFFVQNEAEETIIKLQTIADSSLGVPEPSNRFILCRIEDDTLYQYAQVQISEEMDYPTLKSQLLAILNQEIEPTQKMGEYEAWIGKKRQAKLGDQGSSYATAIVAPSVPFEYQWLRENYPSAKFMMQSLNFHEGKPYDILKVRLEDGSVIEVYFDISSFFGKGFDWLSYF